MQVLYDKGSNAVTLTLSNGSVMIQHAHPQTNAPVTALNFEGVAKACVSADEWNAYLKLKGIDIGGVLCSATAADQNGLLAVLAAYQLQGAAFKPTSFAFENGSSLVLKIDTLQAFIGVWMPFRQSFFRGEATS
jgi:hypothetical protein